MNKLIVTAIRCSLIFLVPVGAYALSSQWAAHGNTASKSTANAKPSQPAARHGKRMAGHSVPAPPSMNGQHLAGGGAHVQHMQTHHHMAARGRHSTGASPTPTPTPATAPALDLSATATPSPRANSTAKTQCFATSDLAPICIQGGLKRSKKKLPNAGVRSRGQNPGECPNAIQGEVFGRQSLTISAKPAGVGAVSLASDGL